MIVRERLVSEMNNAVREELRMALDPPMNLKDISYLAGLLGFNSRRYQNLKLKNESTTLLVLDEWSRENPQVKVTELRKFLKSMKRPDLFNLLKEQVYIEQSNETTAVNDGNSDNKVPVEHVDLSDVYESKLKPVEHVDMSGDTERVKPTEFQNGYIPDIRTRNPTEPNTNFTRPTRQCPAVPRTQPSDKIALVIGNNQYPGRQLRQAAQDAFDVAHALSELGFKVMCVLNLNLEQMRQLMITFTRQLGPGVFAVFYYSGHGYESAGENYLVPIDAEDPGDRTKCIRAQEILFEMQLAKSLFNLIILDTCQERLPAHSQRVDTKLHRLATGNTIIAHSCTTGCYAYEVPSEQKNGIYAVELLKHIRRDDRIENILMDVNTAVSQNGYVPQLGTFQTDAVFDCRLNTPAYGMDTGNYAMRRSRWASQGEIQPVHFQDSNNVVCDIRFIDSPIMQNWLDLCVDLSCNQGNDESYITDVDFKIEVCLPFKTTVKERTDTPSTGDVLKCYNGRIMHLELLQEETLFVVASLSYLMDGDPQSMDYKFDLGRPMIAGIINSFHLWLKETSV